MKTLNWMMQLLVVTATVAARIESLFECLPTVASLSPSLEVPPDLDPLGDLLRAVHRGTLTNVAKEIVSAVAEKNRRRS
jgi:hypothetical protein